MTDLTLPALAAAATAVSTPDTTADQIRALARLHGVAAVPIPLDAFAADVSRLADADVPGDEIADLVVALKHAGVLDSRAAANLYGDHLAQTRG